MERSRTVNRRHLLATLKMGALAALGQAAGAAEPEKAKAPAGAPKLTVEALARLLPKEGVNPT